MNISKEPSAVPAEISVPGSYPETDLILQLARELYRPGGGTDVTPRSAGSPVPLLGSSLPRIGSGAPSDADLAGGYPQASAPTHPPVHSVVQTPDVSAKQPLAGSTTPSGAHAPGNEDSYAFGEPRCNGAAFGDPSSASTECPEPASPAAPARGLDSVGADAGVPLYFLTGRSAVPSHDSAAPVPTTVATALSPLEIESIRRDFPALHQRVNGHPLVWLDNAATTHKPRSVIEATSAFYSRDNSNIHRAAHTLAARSTELFEVGREKVRRFLGAADAREIVFTRGTTEAINLVAQTYGKKHVGAGDEILLTRMEHHANIVPWQLLAQQTGAVIKVAPINDRGELILDEFVRLIGPKTRIISVAHVSNALGTVNPVEQLIALAHARGVPVLVDAAQSTPHLPVNVVALDADFLVFSGHKVFGPTGIGALYGKASLLESMPPWQGGGHMIRDVTFEKTIYQDAPEKFEAGTPDIAGVVGLGAALDYLMQLGMPAIAAYEHALLEYAIQTLSAVPGIRWVGTAAEKASVLSFIIPGRSNESIARHLDRLGIAVRAGHHCAQPAHRHFGLEGTVRPSLAFYNTYAEVDSMVAALHQLPGSDRGRFPG